MAKAVSNLTKISEETDNDSEKYELQCEKCADEGNNEFATKRCKTCNKFFCKKCYKLDQRTHMIKAEKSDGLQSDMDKLKLKTEHKHGEICSLHGEVLDKYCQQHSEFVCELCISSKHRVCIKIATVQQLAAGVKKTKQPNEVLVNMKTLLKAYRTTISKREQDKQPIIEQRSECRRAIRMARERINRKFDELEEKLEKKLELTSNKECGQIDSHIDKCKQVVNAMETAVHRINESMKYKNDAEMFVILKKMSYQLPDFHTILKNIQKEDHVLKFKFRMNEKLRKLLEYIEELGEIHVTSVMKGVGLTINKNVLSGDSGATYLGKGQPPNVPELQAEQDAQTPKRRGSQAGLAVQAGDHHIRLPRETNSCVTSATFLSNGDILMVDKANNKLKLFSMQLKCISSILLTSGLWDVCTSGIKKYDAYVSVSVKCYIQQVNVGSRRLQFGSSFKTDGECWGLCWCNMGLAAIVNSQNGHQVQIMDGVGNIRKRIHYGRDSMPLFTEPMYILSTRNGSRLLVSDYAGDAMICVDPQRGDVVFTYKDDDMYGPHGLAIDEKDCIYLAGHKSHNVHQISPTGKKIKSVLKPSDGVAVPFGLAFYPKTRSLLVTSWSDTVKMLKVT